MLPEPTAPVPVLAEFVVATGRVRVTFDQPLVVDTYTALNWFARWSDLERSPGVVEVFAPNPTVCTISTSVQPSDLGPDIIQYTAAAPDLIGQNGLLVAPFTEPLIGI